VIRWPWPWRKPALPNASTAASQLARHRVNRERNRVIDLANEMRAARGMALIPRRPE